jgi:cell fate (sporulation/competence/biofilm development) regulator YlbF (YheA/YmcA/DUF963 family)
MQTTLEETAINQKTRELCQAILEDPAMQSIRQRVEAFNADDQSRALLDGLMAKGQALSEKQRMALAVSDEEADDFEKHRAAVFANPVTRAFLDAQEEMHQVQESVQKYISKTLELGRMPGPDDLSEGSCGHGCGCHH